jgi:hypothetical protein
VRRPTVDALGLESPPFGELGHLEVQPDGSGVLCHLCGRYFRSLGRHLVGAHGVSPDAYKERFGLNRTTSLACPQTVERWRAWAQEHRPLPAWAARRGRNAPMPPFRLQARLTFSAKARALDADQVEVACPDCGALVLLSRRLAWRPKLCLTCARRRRVQSSLAYQARRRQRDDP